MKSMDELTTKIEEWAVDRKLDVAEPTMQCMKLGEEFGELFAGMNKSDFDKVVDSIGDLYVVLTILSFQLGISIEDCVNTAYNEIKDRNGKTINGMFVKQEDLP